MRILVIGGTSFVGRHIVQRALDCDHEVTLFNRGQTNPDVFPQAEQLTGDRDSDLSALESGEWDATIDVSAYGPRQVTTLLDTLGARTGHYTFISTNSVYAAPQPGYDENAPLKEAAWDDKPNMEKYGELKVACEQVARDKVGDRLLVVRPGYVIGPHDSTHRFTYWVERVAASQPMLGGDEEQPFQGIDGRDLAIFTVGAVERGLVETVHVMAPDEPPTFGELLVEIAKGIDTSEPDVRWIGPRKELPFTTERDDWGSNQGDISRAKGHGLWFRSIADTARDTLRWVRAARESEGYEPRRTYGFPAERERDLLNAAEGQ